MLEPPHKSRGADGESASASDDEGFQRAGQPRCPCLRSLGPDQLRALLEATAETNRRLQAAEDRRRAETCNAITCGLYGVIQGLKSMREDARLLRRLDEEIRQEDLAKQRAEEGEEKRP